MAKGQVKLTNTPYEFGGYPTTPEYSHHYDITVGVPPSGVNRANDMPKSIRPKIRKNTIGYRDTLDIISSLKDSYTIDECLACFRDLTQKDIGEIYLTGSVALFLQGKITRSSFGDLDIIAVGDYSLDDDIYDNPVANYYPPDKLGVVRRALAFNKIKICLFSNVKDTSPVTVNYNGHDYICQSYKNIIGVKMRMALDNFKDLDELLETSFEITYK